MNLTIPLWGPTAAQTSKEAVGKPFARDPRAIRQGAVDEGRA